MNGFEPDGRWFGHIPEVVFAADGDTAAALIPRMQTAIRTYGLNNQGDYRAWPGPNSNTFVAAVMDAVPEIRTTLPPTAIGKDYPYDGRRLRLAPSGTGVKLTLDGYVGVTVAWVEGIEVTSGAVAGLDLPSPGDQAAGARASWHAVVGRSGDAAAEHRGPQPVGGSVQQSRRCRPADKSRFDPWPRLSADCPSKPRLGRGETAMANETVRLAEYAAGLRYEDLPPNVVQRAKDCITDTVAVIVQGADLPGAASSPPMPSASAPADAAASSASMARRCGTHRRRRWPNGALAHAFE